MNCNYILRILLRFGSIGLHISVNGQEYPKHYLEHVDNLYLFVYVTTNLDPPPPLFIPSSQYIIIIFGPPALNIWTPMHVINYMYSSDSEGSGACAWGNYVVNALLLMVDCQAVNAQTV